MIYSRRELKEFEFEDCGVVMQRYLHKFMYDKKNFKRLKWHEKDFFFQHLQILRNNNDNKGFDLLTIPEALDYLFEKIIVIYANNGKIDFGRKTKDYDGVIKNRIRQKHQCLYWKKLFKWRSSLEKGEGSYKSVILPMRNRKLKELDILFFNRRITKQTQIQRRNFIDTTFYHIYYKAKCYFDELNEKYVYQTIEGYEFYADIYTYCHVMSRHYFPQMNNGIGGTLNDDIPYIDIFELPTSLLLLIIRYTSVSYITENTEYLLFEMDGTKYILWIKFVVSKEGKKRFQIRSFYKCTDQRDLCKFKSLTAHLKKCVD